MNILWLNKISDTENWRTTQIELTKSLRKRGHNVKLVMAKNIGEKKLKNNDNISYFPTLSHSFLSGMIFGLIIAFYFPLIVRKKNTDIIIIDATSIWLPFAMPLKLLKIPIILDIRDIPVNKKKPVSFDIPLYLSKSLIEGLTTITPELRDILNEKFGLYHKKIGLWPSGVSLENFIKSINDTNEKYPNKSEKFIVIHHGSHGKKRGIENLIKSIGELDNSLRKKVKLLLVGVTEERQREYLPLCVKIGVKNQVEMIGKVEYEKIPEYIKSSDIGIIPLPPDEKWWRVSVPLKTLEYLGMGKPIIATSIPFHQKIFEEGKCGILIDDSNPKTFSEAIKEMYRNKDKFNEMGKKGKEIVKKYYTWDSIALQLEKFIKTILAENKNEYKTK